jgi:dienelactone hydrolase
MAGLERTWLREVGVTRRRISTALFLLAATTKSIPLAAGAAATSADLNEEIVSIPAVIHGQTFHLEATLFRPNKMGTFPLIVINHGTSPEAFQNSERKRYLVASNAFVSQGFAVVVPMRRGYGSSEGNRVGDGGGDLTRYGRENALDIKAAIQFLKTQSYVYPKRIIVIGQSTGGLATMAYLSMADEGVLGGINFHGGVRPRNFTDDPLLGARIEAFATYAKTTRLPSLWFYTANDHSSRPPFIARLYDAYQRAGGKAQLVQLGPFLADGHTLFERPEGLEIWWPKVSAFMANLPGA